MRTEEARAAGNIASREIRLIVEDSSCDGG